MRLFVFHLHRSVIRRRKVSPRPPQTTADEQRDGDGDQATRRCRWRPIGWSCIRRTFEFARDGPNRKIRAPGASRYLAKAELFILQELDDKPVVDPPAHLSRLAIAGPSASTASTGAKSSAATSGP